MPAPYQEHDENDLEVVMRLGILRAPTHIQLITAIASPDVVGIMTEARRNRNATLHWRLGDT
jgi:hypothetical protein